MGEDNTPDDAEIARETENGRLKSAIRRRPFLKATGSGIAMMPLVSSASAHDVSSSGEPWYGLPLPTGLSSPHEPTGVVGDDYEPEPAKVPPGEQQYKELEGETLREYLETIVGFSQQSYQEGNRFWGRIPGRPSLTNTINWVADQFREAGIPDVEVQEFEASDPIWRPGDWEVRLLGDSTFGNGSEDVVLESAFPTYGSTIPSESLTAPLAYVGNPKNAKINQIDVDGKIAVQHAHPDQGSFTARDVIQEGTKHHIEQGAVAVLNIVELSGNMHVNFGGSDNVREWPSFNLGYEDGSFLEQVMMNAAQEGVSDELRIQIELKHKMQKDATAENAVGILPGKKDENILINAHADGWFDAANDNGSGLAVLVGIARHFAKLNRKPERNLVFVASAGHNTPHMDGPANFAQMNPNIAKNNSLLVNIEHPAAKDNNPILFRSEEHKKNHQLSYTGTVEDPMLFGVTNESPFLKDLASEAIDRYGISLIQEAQNTVPGDIGGYLETIDSPAAQIVFVDHWYHTSGDVIDNVSTPGMERAARFYTFFVKQASKKKGLQE